MSWRRVRNIALFGAIGTVIGYRLARKDDETDAVTAMQSETTLAVRILLFTRHRSRSHIAICILCQIIVVACS